MNIKLMINELENELKSIFEEYENNIPVSELERFGYVQGYLDALKEIYSLQRSAKGEKKMNSYYLKIMKAPDDIVLKQFKDWRDTCEKFPDDEGFRRDYLFLLSVLLDRGYSEEELV